MAAFIHILKTIFIPLFLAALLYIALAHLLLPFIRRHRSRYSHYLPITPSLTTNTWRTRLSDALYNLFIPASWATRWHNRRRRVVDGSACETALDEEELFDDEEGEGMVGFDPIEARRREALERRRSVGVGEEERRLSRELEEGFRDDSEEEEEEGEEECRRERSRARA